MECPFVFITIELDAIFLGLFLDVIEDVGHFAFEGDRKAARCHVPGSWFLVPGSWFLVPGSWFLVPGSCLPLVLRTILCTRPTRGPVPLPWTCIPAATRCAETDRCLPLRS